MAEIGSVDDTAIYGQVIGGAMSTPNLWKRYQQYLCQVPSLGLTLDVSRMRFEDGFLERMDAPMQRAFEAMDALERGDIANPDENRMVGHYWLRAPSWPRHRQLPPKSAAPWLRSSSLRALYMTAPSGLPRASSSPMYCPSALAVRPSARCLWPMPLGTRVAIR